MEQRDDRREEEERYSDEETFEPAAIDEENADVAKKIAEAKRDSPERPWVSQPAREAPRTDKEASEADVVEQSETWK